MKRWMVYSAVAVLALGLVSSAEAGRGRDGRGGHGHGGHHGHHGGKGGHGTPSPAPSVSAPAAPQSPAQLGGGLTTGTGLNLAAEAKPGLLNARQAQTDKDTREAMVEAGHFGLGQIDRINEDGSFTYSGYEWWVAAFAQAMQKRGYDMGSAGQPSTNLYNGLPTDAFGG